MIYLIPPLCDITVPLLGPYQMAGFADSIGYSFEIHDLNIAFAKHIVKEAPRDAVQEKTPLNGLDSIEEQAVARFIAQCQNFKSYDDVLNGLRNCTSLKSYWHTMDYMRACYDAYSLKFNNMRFKIDGFDTSYRWNIWNDSKQFISDAFNSELLPLIQNWLDKISFPNKEIIGINITFDSQYFFALLICAVLRKTRPDLRIVIGGGFVNSFIDSAESIGPLGRYCDTVCADEGEALLWDLNANQNDSNKLHSLGQ
ncbi:MAG: cobalamin B12-binding domain-containing protein, partial [Spirochaetaceae bacterium]|nr:cobalamin B12-binding domain-containing protein [Spirochaetaceae bacterium]